MPMILAHLWLGFCPGLCHKIWRIFPLFPCEAHDGGHLSSLRRILVCSGVGLLCQALPIPDNCELDSSVVCGTVWFFSVSVSSCAVWCLFCSSKVSFLKSVPRQRFCFFLLAVVDWIIKEASGKLSCETGRLRVWNLWQLKNKLRGRYNDPPTAINKRHGNLVTGSKVLEKLTKKTYINRLKALNIKKGLVVHPMKREELCENNLKKHMQM